MIPIDKAREAFAKHVLISLTAQGLEPSALESIDSLVNKSNGNCSLVIKVKTLANEQITMNSSKYQVNPDYETINGLRELLGKDNVKIAG